MTWILLLALASLLLLAIAVVVVAVVFALSRRPGPPSYGPAHRPTFSTPLERPAAASVLNREEWDEFRRWVEGQRPLPPSAGEGITR